MRKRTIILIAAAAGLLVATSSARAAGILQRILRVLGMSAAPGQMKGPDTDAGPGQIWIADLHDGTRRALTTDGGFRWPVFEIGEKTIVALRGGQVVRVSLQTGKVDQQREARGVDKLVGVDPAQPDEVLVVLNNAPAAPLAMLSLKTGTLTPLPLDRNDANQKQLLTAARGETRVYENRRLFLQTDSRVAEEGTREWQNVYLQDGTSPPRPVSLCKDLTCHQPSLSPSGRRVAYVQANP